MKQTRKAFQFYICIIFICTFFISDEQVVCANKSSSAAAVGTTDTYVPVAALDEYGQSSQLRNAMLASSKHGKLILAAKANDNSGIVVCSTFTYNDYEDVDLEKDHRHRLIQVIALDQSSSNDACTALVCSGLRADAVLLIRLLRDYARRVWDYYDVLANAGRVAEAMVEILSSCMNHDDSDTLVDGAGPVIADKDFSMARPFGVSSFVIGTNRKGAASTQSATCTLVSVDPSGIQQEWVANAMGRNSDEARRLLEKEWTTNMSLEQIRDCCESIIRRLENENSNLDDSNKLIISETLTSRDCVISRQISSIQP